MLISILFKGLFVGVIVGFVTASIKSWVDRFFLVILLVSMMGLPIQQAVSINLVVVSIAALMMVLRQWEVLDSVRNNWAVIVIPSVFGGVLGRLFGLQISARALLITLGIYAILVGLRLVLIKPMPQKETQAHPAWQAPIAFLAGWLTGLLSAGGKPFKVPAYNWLLGRHPKRAYALASLGVAAAAWSALLSQFVVGERLSPNNLILAIYEFIVITVTALGVGRIWSQKLGKAVTLIIAPILALVGVRFLIMARG